MLRQLGMYLDRKLQQRKESPRLDDFDYTNPGYYFVTICTKHKIHYFGGIHDHKMTLNDIGQIANDIWQSIPDHYPNVSLDEYVIMPNHIHGIIIIRENADYKNVGTAHCAVRRTSNGAAIKRTEQCSVPTKTRYGLLSKIVKSFKNCVTIKVKNELNIQNFSWQRSFYDHVIRSEKGLKLIRDYINNNPVKWRLDRFYNE